MEELRKKDANLLAQGPFVGMIYMDLHRILTSAGETERAAEILRKAEQFGRGRGPAGFGPRAGPPNASGGRPPLE
jgi:hypothetical protein